MCQLSDQIEFWRRGRYFNQLSIYQRQQNVSFIHRSQIEWKKNIDLRRRRAWHLTFVLNLNQLKVYRKYHGKFCISSFNNNRAMCVHTDRRKDRYADLTQSAQLVTLTKNIYIYFVGSATPSTFYISYIYHADNIT